MKIRVKKWFLNILDIKIGLIVLIWLLTFLVLTEWKCEGLLTLLLFALSGYYIYVSKIIHLKGSGEVKKDILLAGFWIVLLWFLFTLGFVIPGLKESPLASNFPKWTYLFIELCFFFLTFRAAAEGISITRRWIDDKTGRKEEGDEDGNLFLIKVTAEMIGVYLLFPVSFIYICTSLGIRWWYLMVGPTGKLIFIFILSWILVIYLLPGTYKSTQCFLKLIIVLVLVLGIALSCVVGGQKAGLPFGIAKDWNPAKESVFEYRARMKGSKVEAKKKAERKEIIIFRSAPQVIPVLPAMEVNLKHFRREYPKMLIVDEKKRILSKRKTPEHYYNSSNEIRYLYLYESCY